MATIVRLETPSPNLRARLVDVTRRLRETGALTDTDGPEQTADAVLAEVTTWLLQRASSYRSPLARAALRATAREIGPTTEGQD